MIQQLLWNQLYRAKVHANYLELLLRSTEGIDRAIKIFLAIASSSSIGGWAIWKEYGFLWGGIIAASQVLGAVLPFLPYKERLKSFSSLAREIEEIAIYLEIKWLEVSAGEVSERDMRKLYAEILKKKAGAVQKYFPNNSIPSDDKKLAKAEEEAISYFGTYLN